MKVSILLLNILLVFGVCNAKFFESKAIPFGWEHQKDVSLSPMTVTFAIKQQNIDKLEDIFWKVSTPGTDSYRKFLKPKDILEITSPGQSTIRKINNWLLKNDIKENQIELNYYNDFMIVNSITAAKLESLLKCRIESFYHKESKKTTQICVNGYSIPDEIAENIDFVSGVSYFPNVKHKIPLAPRASSNEPILVKAFPGDKNFVLFYAPVCSDGTPASSYYQGSMNCANGNSIQMTAITATQNAFTHAKNLDNLLCMNCTSWPSALQSYCLQTNEEYSLPASTAYCHSNPLGFNLENYIPIKLTMTTIYTSGSSIELKVPQPIYLGEFITPKVLRNHYGISDAQAICKHPQNTQSVAEFLGQNYSPQDLLSFFSMTGTLYPGHVELVGANNVTNPGIEASLDIQYIMGVAQNVTTYFWSLSNLHDGQEPFLEWIIQVLNSQNPPLVHSISYGDDESSLTSDYMNRVNVEFQKAGSLGVTLLFSSGDNGVNAADPSAPSCTDISAFTPGFPASSPYVTAVGGTQFSTRSESICSSITQYGVPITCNIVGEISASIATGARITSGGGFSNVFAMPSYQKTYVTNYLKSQSNIPSQYYNASGRAYPDISACARNFLVVNDGQIHPTDGTSAAAPTAAAMMTLINDHLIDSNQKLGFLNPTLYALDTTNFIDIIEGDNSCGEDIDSCCPYGFSTTTGWDAVTGLGSINFQNLLVSLTS